MARENPNWFAQALTVDDTGAVPMEAIDEDRASGMPEEMIQQEYWCSFDAPLVGSYYGDYLCACQLQAQATAPPPEPGLLGAVGFVIYGVIFLWIAALLVRARQAAALSAAVPDSAGS